MGTDPASISDGALDPPSPVTKAPAIPVNKRVFVGASAGIIGIIVWAFIDADGADRVIQSAVTWVADELGWFYIGLVVAVVLFVVWAALSRVGGVKLGPDHSKPVYNLFSWTAMLFAAGIGIDLMFFSVAEPVTQWMSPPTGDGQTVEATRQAVVWTLFHYGIIGWSLYALIGMSLGYFAYRYNQPLSLRSGLRPIFGDRLDGILGDSVDIAALLGAIFGLATSLGIGVAQLNVGLEDLFGIAQSHWAQAGLIVVAVAIATLSAVSGVDKGVKRLSEINVIIALGLLLFILIAGSTTYLMNALVQNVGDFASRFPSMALDTFAYEDTGDWKATWTLFFWAWWIAWAPFVGLFLARISRGRTIRQFVFGTLTIPFVFIVIWISIFGNSALEIARGNKGFADTAVNTPEEGFYALLHEYPGATVLVVIATFTGMLFYITSADSGALVMAHFSSHVTDNDSDAGRWVRIFWAVVTGLLTMAMLLIGGITTLQNATVIMGLPFAVVVALMMLGLFRALQAEGDWVDSRRSALTHALSHRSSGGTALNWRQRVKRLVQYPDADDVRGFSESIVRPALADVVDELVQAGMDATTGSAHVDAYDLTSYHLDVDFGGGRTFHYQVYPTRHPTPVFGRSPDAGDLFFRLEVFTAQGSEGFDVYGLTEAQISSNVLDHYERHLHYLEIVGGDTATIVGENVTDWSADFDNGPDPATTETEPAAEAGTASPAKEES
ncbi:choline BCCT transporter BetT [Gordonia liuliyuniae]|uniref:Choline BCCT transporter BetT n=1 Tax=Gordonia liuliyuniae TaxID=2911517 RepID=A0ABS9IWC2_9ACTN|nr:choline BCCT transporter BetT [Gordonia liuliyuniae]MCF8589826.1 choline BCCT transporter BetT [Gordonia liuliyuniae]